VFSSRKDYCYILQKLARICKTRLKVFEASQNRISCETILKLNSSQEICSATFVPNATAMTANKNLTRCQFHQCFTISFFAYRSRKHKKDWQLLWFFALLGSAQVKAAHRSLMKSTPGHGISNICTLLFAFYKQVFCFGLRAMVLNLFGSVDP